MNDSLIGLVQQHFWVNYPIKEIHTLT